MSPFMLFLVAIALSFRHCYAIQSDSLRNSTCAFDSVNPTGSFRLLDPADGVPFVHVDGELKKATQTLTHIPEYRFVSNAESKAGIHDIRLDSAYLAIFDTGKLGFVNESSKGSEPISRHGTSFVTTTFRISCGGVISLQLPWDVNATFAYHPSSQNVLVRLLVNHTELERRSMHSFIRRVADGFDVMDFLEPFDFLTAPFGISDHFQVGGSPRCSKRPLGLEVFVKPGARAAYYNGCGAENGMKVPDFRFTECCDNHDLCYDDCFMQWEACNDNFRSCMHQQCTNFYALPFNASNLAGNRTTWTEWGCQNLADTYADFVGSPLGSWSFRNSNYDRCDCACPTNIMNCTDICLPDCSKKCDVIDCTTTSATGWFRHSHAPTSTKTSLMTTTSKGVTSAANAAPTTLSATTNKPSDDDSNNDDPEESWWSRWSPFKSISKSEDSTPQLRVTTYWWWPL